MPTYELALMLRAMPKPELKSTLKRISHAIFDRGGIIRNIENLGFRPMPYKSAAHGLVHREANYFVIKIDTATKAVADLTEEYSRDVDVIRQRFFRSQEDSQHNCSLEEELLPPAYRKDVQKMIEIGKTQLEELVNRQIQAEQQAAQDYLSIAVAFLHPSVSQLGAGGYFMHMYKEELKHMQVFIKYQLMRGGTPVINGLKAPTKHKNLNLLDAFKQALIMEKSITELLEETLCVAAELNDYQCADFISATFLGEQMQDISEISHHITKLTQLGDSQHAIYHYDLRLAQLYPYSIKKLDLKH